MMVMFLVSSGWRNTSIVDLENSGSSSRNNAPLCARLISPGFGTRPPPIRLTWLAVW